MICYKLHNLFTGTNKFKALMGIKHQTSNTTFRKIQTRLLGTEENLLDEQIHRNRLEELSLIRSDPSTKYKDGKPLITVKSDGSWSKAGGFISKFGFACLLSNRIEFKY